MSISIGTATLLLAPVTGWNMTKFSIHRYINIEIENMSMSTPQSRRGWTKGNEEWLNSKYYYRYPWLGFVLLCLLILQDSPIKYVVKIITWHTPKQNNKRKKITLKHRYGNKGNYAYSRTKARYEIMKWWVPLSILYSRFSICHISLWTGHN